MSETTTMTVPANALPSLQAMAKPMGLKEYRAANPGLTGSECRRNVRASWVGYSKAAALAGALELHSLADKGCKVDRRVNKTGTRVSYVATFKAMATPKSAGGKALDVAAQKIAELERKLAEALAGKA